jgi:hypothetical protein
LPPPETLVWAPAGRHTQKRKPGPGVWRGAAAGRWPGVLSVGADWGRDRGELSWRRAASGRTVVIGVVCRGRCGGKVKPFQTRASGMRALSSLSSLSPLSPLPLPLPSPPSPVETPTPCVALSSGRADWPSCEIAALALQTSPPHVHRTPALARSRGWPHASCTRFGLGDGLVDFGRFQRPSAPSRCEPPRESRPGGAALSLPPGTHITDR